MNSLIKKSHELALPEGIKMMIYGQAGMGKTTYALSAPRPLLLDFDGGVNRVNLNHLKDVGIVQVSSWADMQALLKEDLREYQTIVVDTVGKMMDAIISYKCGTKQPQLRDWGGINQEFANFNRALSDLKKNVVYVAHRADRKEGDETVFVPSFRSKNYNDIVTELDLLGYMETKSENGVVYRSITFDPTPRNDGKNACNLPSVMAIPELIDKQGNSINPNNTIQEAVLKPYFAMLDAKKENARKYDEVVKELKDNIALITDDVSANDFVSRIDAFEHIGNSKALAGQLLHAKAQELKLKYNKTTKQYEPAEPAA